MGERRRQETAAALRGCRRLRRRPFWPPMRWAALACAIGLVCRGDCYVPRGTVCLDSSFETDTGDWRTWFTASKFTQWKRNEGSTPTGNTGPSQAEDQSYYWYVETNPWQNGGWPYPSTWSNLPDDATNLESPMVSGASDLSFYYHMYGSGIGTLEVYALDADLVDTGVIWTRTGGKQTSSDDDWEQVHVYVPAGTAKVGFRVNRKGTRWWSGYYGNVAIDQVVLECGGGPPAPPAPPPALCTDDCPPYPHYTSDGWCDDGGSESQYSLCPLGSDCQDCGPRIIAEPCDIEMDLVLVLDKSGSMWSYHSQLKEFAKSLVRQFVIGPTSTAIGLVEFSTDARVLSVGGVNGLSFDADALMQVIDSMASPNGWTHINAGLEMGLQVMLGTNGTEPNSRPNVRRRIMVLLTDGEQNSQFGGTKKAIETAKATTAAGDFILKSVGFGGILESTLNDMASEPISENAYLGNNLQAVMEHFSGFCSQLSSPRPPPPPSPLPASPSPHP